MPSKVKLTDAVAGRTVLPPGKSDLIVWDTDLSGFGLRVRPSGKAWILAYRPLGAGRSANMQKLRIGSPDTQTATQARNLARIELGKVAAGSNPLAVRKAEKQRERARLADMLDAYEADLQRRQYVNSSVVANGLRGR